MKNGIEEMNAVIPIITSYCEQNKTIFTEVSYKLMCKTKKIQMKLGNQVQKPEDTNGVATRKITF